MATTTRTVQQSRSPVQTASGIVGAVFLGVGILGFVPGVTQNLGDITFAGHESGAELLGIFQVSVLHNLVHALFGVLGLVAAGSLATARTYLIGGGAVYLVLWLYGIAIDKDSAANFVPLSHSDDWLHLGLGTGMILTGLALTRAAATGRSGGTARTVS